jgi:hypothetical protein
MDSLALIIFVVSEKKAFERKMFQNASSLKPLGQLNPNCPGMIIGRSSTNFLFFYADRKFKILGSLVSTVLVVSEKKRFETFPP